MEDQGVASDLLRARGDPYSVTRVGGAINWGKISSAYKNLILIGRLKEGHPTTRLPSRSAKYAFLIVDPLNREKCD